MNFGQPDQALAGVRYARLADRYDESCRRIAPIREEAIALLGLRAGDTVLDVGCGTGLSFALLHAGVGSTGRVVGIELSAHMSAMAHQRAAGLDAQCIRVVEGPANAVALGTVRFDAVLFHYTHDVLRSTDALAHLFTLVKPGARVAVAGVKCGSNWVLPLSLIAMFRARNYLTTFEGIRAPWGHLLRSVPDFRWQPRLAGTSYVGWGHATQPCQAERAPSRSQAVSNASVADPRRQSCLE